MADDDDDPRYEVANEARKAVLRDIGARIARTLEEADPNGPRLGFGLFLFDFGPGGAMFWISNAEREDMHRALREFLRREGRA